MFTVLLRCGADDEDVINVCVGEGDAAESLIHESLKRLCCIAQAEGHPHNRPDGVVTAPHLQGLLEFDDTHVRGPVWRRWWYPARTRRSHGCGGQGSDRGLLLGCTESVWWRACGLNVVSDFVHSGAVWRADLWEL